MKADDFIQALKTHITEAEKDKLQRFYKGSDSKTRALGVRFGTVFKIAKEFVDLPLPQVEQLLESHYYEVRMGAVAILDHRARKKLSDDQRRELYELYIRRHDRIDNWDLVDRAAPHVVGHYLFDKSRDVLYKLAKSQDPWQRRTALYSTLYFVKKGDLDDTLKLAHQLVNDPEELINKAVGTMLREVGKKAPERLWAFLDQHAATMPRITLRYATEKLDTGTRQRYMTTAT